MPLEQTLEWFKAAKPNPTDKDLIVQTGCHFEEVVEMLDCAVGASFFEASLIIEAKKALHALAEHMKSSPLGYTMGKYDPVALLDSLADQNVTGAGVAYMAGMDMIGAMREVNRSNFSKFEDGKPVFKDTGKIGKGKNYTEPDLKPFV
ncbi:MazG-like nucleotide pyrophosphohydrolase [Stenotrophomonas phage C121]|uniref:nucleotide pyrophosphohydrolase n=1 Tax=Stenotrophomonas phage C121 TaxID=2914029 RepID=UPI0023292B0D|nr:nucleotide pyrophosphohydrolase [Stenotrophomonas phage C121]UKL14793.1 MazG-like nucleotide pyrophosphohydrolase [Stenotrophomonas phage C121]